MHRSFKIELELFRAHTMLNIYIFKRKTMWNINNTNICLKIFYKLNNEMVGGRYYLEYTMILDQTKFTMCYSKYENVKVKSIL